MAAGLHTAEHHEFPRCSERCVEYDGGPDNRCARWRKSTTFDYTVGRTERIPPVTIPLHSLSQKHQHAVTTPSDRFRKITIAITNVVLRANVSEVERRRMGRMQSVPPDK